MPKAKTSPKQPAPIPVYNLCDYDRLYIAIVDELEETVMQIEFDRGSDDGVSITFDGFARGTKTGAALVCDVDAPANRKAKKHSETISPHIRRLHGGFLQLKGKRGKVLFALHQDSTSESLTQVKVEAYPPEPNQDAQYTFIIWNAENKQEVKADE